MSSPRFSRFLRLLALVPLFAFCVSHAQESQLISGQNVNMVSGTDWPNGDPFLQRQNEPSIGVSSRNELHLLAGSNDYRTVDLPGLPEGKTTGDSWMSMYFSYDGGGRWISTLLPGYPQDQSDTGMASPIFGYEASADPVIRSGTHGLFYYAGIAFDRGESPKSSGFISRFIDLNNDERNGSIEYLGTSLYDEDLDGSDFIDKPWIAVDKPRGNAQTKILSVDHDDDPQTPAITQEVQCGNLYVAWARIRGDGTSATSSDLMFARSEDCGDTFIGHKVLNTPNTINQGAAIAVDPQSGRVQVAWRQFASSTMSCTEKSNYWRDNPDAWPVDEITLAGYTLSSASGGTVIVNNADDDDDHDYNNDDGDSDDHENDENFEFDWDDDADKPNGLMRQLLAAWLNVLSGADPTEIADELAEAEAWLVDNPLGSKPAKAAKKRGNQLRKILRDFNKGKLGVKSCSVVTSMDAGGVELPNAIMTVYSTDNGDTFSTPISASGDNYFPFEQGTTEYSFRSSGYPTMTFDGDGRAYIAFTTRGLAVPDFDPVGGDGRIVVTTSNDGSNWSFPLPIDEPEVRGHQFMPALEFSRGKVFLLYYDFRDDISGVFDRFVTDRPVDATTPRHTVDVRTAQADAADVPEFTNYSVSDQGSTQASRYPYLLIEGTAGPGGDPQSQQTQYNPPNLPMFKGGLVPFFGDFIDIAAVHFTRDEFGVWDFDTDPANGSPVVHAVWTDNRDIVPPLDGDWTSYVPPTDPNNPGGMSIFDPSQAVPVCTPGVTGPDRTKMRNQNIYTSRLTQGLAVALPGNNRPLGVIQRAFVSFVQNLTNENKFYRLEILNQPVGGAASFEQFSISTSIDEKVNANSSISRSIFANSTSASASIDILVTEIYSLGGAPILGGLTATARINPDPSAPAPSDNSILTEENYTPAVFNPAIFNPAVFNPALLGTDPKVGIYSADLFANSSDPTQAALQQMSLLNPAVFNPAIFNPAVFNPAVFNPAVFNPAVFNPAVFNPAVFNPAVFNPAVFNPAVFNPAVFNPAVFNPAVFNTSLVETSVVIENQGNTTAAYSLNLDLENPPTGFLFQVMVYKTYQVPEIDGCNLVETTAQEQLVNELTPNVDGSLLDPNSTSFYIPPGDNVVVTVRIVPDPNNPVDPTTIATLPTLDLSQSVVPQAVDTVSAGNGETEPTPVTILAPSVPVLAINAVSLNNGAVGSFYSQTLGTTGGNGSPVSWSLAPLSAPLPAGLILNAASGQITGTPGIGTQGLYSFTARARDNDQTAQQGFSLQIDAGVVVTSNALFAETVIVNDQDIQSDGTLLVANNLGNLAEPQTINGLPFGDQQPWTGSGLVIGGGDFSVDPTFSVSLDAVLSNLVYSPTLNPIVRTVNGLTQGENYRIQMLFSNDLNLTGNEIQVTVEGVTHVLNNWQDDAINLVVDFEASGTSVNVTFEPGPDYVPGSFAFDEPGRVNVNAYAVHQVDYIFDQKQAVFDTTVGVLALSAVGVASEQKLAQVVTAGITGTLDEVRMPVSCSSGDLQVEIQGVNASGVPNGVVLASETFSAAEMPTFAGGSYGGNVVFLRPFNFSSPTAFNAGDQFAIVLEAVAGGSCALYQGPATGDSYPGGKSFFDARPNQPGWVETFGTTRLDYPFMTKMTPGPQVLASLWRADFDLSSSTTASGPFVCLRNWYTFSTQPAVANMNVEIYDENGGPSIGNEGYSVSGGSNLGDEILVSGSALADGVGYMLIEFTDETLLQSVEVEGRSGQCIGGGVTGYFFSTLTKMPIGIIP